MKLTELLTEGYTAYEVPPKVRQMLSKKFPPKFPEFIGHHITNVFGVRDDGTVPIGKTAHVEVHGYVEEPGLEALVVSVNGKNQRPDGKQYHITWSLDRSAGKKPVHSNNLIQRGGVQPVEPLKFDAILKFFD
jgi:hypothetical protein